MSAPSVIVSGTIAKTPWEGGATWAILQYLLGLRRLGCAVYFIEPVDVLDEDAVRYCGGVLTRYGLADRWALIPTIGDPAGLSRHAIREAAHSADVLLNVSGMLTARDVFEAVPIRAYVDLDPGFIQLWHDVEGIDMHLEGHTHFISIADSIGSPHCPIPTCGRAWLSTLPPVVLDEWPVAPWIDRRASTTVGHWRSYGTIEHNGVRYGQKAHALRPLIDLPTRTEVEFQLALEIHPDETSDLDALRDNGWKLLDPQAVAATPDEYRRFVQGSWAEFGIAKSGYVVSNSGWFSDRSACYLASGRPVIAQDTGFGRRLPVGEGLFAFTTGDDVLAALDELTSDYDRHRAAAREIAAEFLDSDRVLGSLLERLCR